jgi:D-aminoacyl-tRNA deacylase
MRAIIQRVSQASVTCNNTITGAIQTGFLILLGVEHADTQEDANWLAGKIARLRIFNDEAGLMNRSIDEVHGDMLVVSQFTLHASTKKGNRPSYIQAARPEHAMPLYEYFTKQLQSQFSGSVYTGVFGGDMQVSLCNNGPVTIFIDSQQKE